MIYKLFTDGGSRGNPGNGAAGVVLLDSQDIQVATTNKFLGICTNNEAEYAALILGLSLAKKHNVKHLVAHLDSELIVKQLNGEYKVKNERLQNYYAKAVALTKDFDNVVFKHIPRSQNAEADLLVNQALDDHAKN